MLFYNVVWGFQAFDYAQLPHWSHCSILIGWSLDFGPFQRAAAVLRINVGLTFESRIQFVVNSITARCPSPVASNQTITPAPVGLWADMLCLFFSTYVIVCPKDIVSGVLQSVSPLKPQLCCQVLFRERRGFLLVTLPNKLVQCFYNYAWTLVFNMLTEADCLTLGWMCSDRRLWYCVKTHLNWR